MQQGVSRAAEADHRFLLRQRAGARGLAEHRAADASQFSVSHRVFSSGLKAVPVRLLERLLELARRVSAVVGRAKGRLVRERLLRNEIDAAQLESVDVELARRLVHQPLDEVRDVWTARAA